ncbi:ATP-grasp domain-containing protein [Roseateles sp.]|uniref:ATP-grasp domain-containing protein n=1 Tax=Roseateles sp. TaxID=1971397 RepID=UPI003BAAEFF9
MAHLLVIELPGGNDTDILSAALEQGHAFTFLCESRAMYDSQPVAGVALTLADAVIEVPGFDDAAVEAAVLRQHERRAIDAVICLIDIRLVEAARLAQRLGLAHISPQTAALLRDKFSVRQRLAAHGMAQPDFALAETNPAIRAAVDRLGLPVLIKPADGYGSQNIVVLRHATDLDPLLSPLDGLLPCRADYGLGVHANDRLLVERYMHGVVVGCDTLTVKGEHRLLGVNEKQCFELPSLAISGGCFQADTPAFDTIRRYVFAVLDAVGFDCGATHTEVMLTADGPRLIEVNARLVGAKIPRLLDYALGRSVHADLIDVHLGRQPAPRPRRAESGVAATRWIVAPRPGTLARVVLPPHRHAGLRCVELLKRPGQRVRPPIENADRIGYVMTTAPTRAEAERLADQFVQDTHVLLVDDADAGGWPLARPGLTERRFEPRPLIEHRDSTVPWAERPRKADGGLLP